MSNNQKILYLLFGVGLIIIYIVLALTIFQKTPPDVPMASPTPETSPDQPTPTATPVFEGLRKNTSTDRLSAQELRTRQSLISRAHRATGLVYAGEDFQIFYLKEDDLFQARILSLDIPETKDAVLEWFGSQGLRGFSICDLPLLFYVNPRLLEESGDKDFSPLPDACI